MEKIEITTRFKTDGSLIPVEFSTRSGKVKVLDIGRQWENDQGRHLLVMDAGRNTYHLLFQISDLSWYWVKDLQPGPNRI